MAEYDRQALAAAWAISNMGAQNYHNLCEQFIELAYGTSNRFTSAAQAGSTLASSKDLSKADVGDLLFFRADPSNGGAGHAAIYVGNGEMVGAINGGVKRSKIMDGGYWQNLFAGFADPPSTWKGTPSTPELVQGAAAIAAGGAAMAGDQPRARSLIPIAQWGGAGSYLQEITAAAQKYGIPVNMLAAKVNVESGGNPNATSPAGARGLLQLMPDTARSLGVTDITSISQNLDAGAKYFKQQYDRFGNWGDALRAYNAGPAGNWNNAETNNHVTKVFANMNLIAGAMPSGSTGTAAPRAPTAPAADTANPFAKFMAWAQGEGGAGAPPPPPPPPPSAPGGGSPGGGAPPPGNDDQGKETKAVPYTPEQIIQEVRSRSKPGTDIILQDEGRAKDWSGHNKYWWRGPGEKEWRTLTEEELVMGTHDTNKWTPMEEEVLGEGWKTAIKAVEALANVPGAVSKGIDFSNPQVQQAIAGASLSASPSNSQAALESNLASWGTPATPGAAGAPGAPAPGTPPATGAAPVATGSGGPRMIPVDKIKNAGLKAMAETHNKNVQELEAVEQASKALVLPPTSDPTYASVKAQKAALDGKAYMLGQSIQTSLPSITTGIQNETPGARTDQIVPGSVVATDQKKFAVAKTDADGNVSVEFHDNPGYVEGTSASDIAGGNNAAMLQRGSESDTAAMERERAGNLSAQGIATGNNQSSERITAANNTAAMAREQAGNTSAQTIAAGNQTTQRATSALAAAIQQESARTAHLIEIGKLDLAEATERFNEWKTKNVDAPLAILTQQREAAKLQLQQQEGITARASGQSTADTARANAGTAAYTSASNAYNETMKQTISSGDAAMAQGTMNYNPSADGATGNQYGTGTFNVNESMDAFASRKVAETLAGISPYAQNILASTQQMGDPGAVNTGALADTSNQAIGTLNTALSGGGPNAGRVAPPTALPPQVNIGAMATAGMPGGLDMNKINSQIPSYGT